MAVKPTTTPQRASTMPVEAPSQAAPAPASPGNRGRRTVDLLSIPVDPLTMDEVLTEVMAAVQTRRRLLIGVVNAAKVVNMGRDAELRDSVLSSDLVLADGMSVVWAGRVLGRAIPERVAGIDLMTRILELADVHRLRVYFLGATEAVSRAAVERVQAEHPALVVAGRHHGYFGPDDEPALVESIRAAGPDVLFVAMSPPKKERFLARWADALEVPVLHGVGGSLDVVAGKVNRAPERWQRLGLEWAWRVVQEPRRLWKRYLVTNTLFGALVLRELPRARLGALVERAGAGRPAKGARGAPEQPGRRRAG